jgi:hypothetical protein
VAKRIVKTRDCDRCPRNRKPNAATRTVPFSFGTEHWKIDLCDECHARMEREMHSWGRLGVEDESFQGATRFTQETTEAGRRLAALRTRQQEPRIVAEATKATKPMHLAGPIPEGLPADAGDWIFDPHAIMRMGERKITTVQALKAACSPDVVQPSKTDPNVYWHWHGDIKAVVDPVTQVIFTVARREAAEDRKAM